MKQVYFNLVIAAIGIFVSLSASAKYWLGPYDKPPYVEGSVYNMEEESGFIYNGMVYFCNDFDNKEVTLTTYLVYDDDNPGVGGLYSGELDVPSFMINEDTNEQYTVTGVSALFRNGVTVLRLPETIKTCWSINKCSLLREVYLNDNLKEFYGISDCPHLTVCPLPSSLEYVGENSMSGLGMKEIKFPPLLASVGDKTFCRNYELESLDLGNIEAIGDSCFNVLPILSEITLPETLRSIGKDCFRYCYGIENINLPSQRIDIDMGCFAECNMVKTVTVAAETPYSMPAFLNPDNQVYDITVYVPDESVDAYKNAEGWQNHKILSMSIKSGVGELEASQPNGWKVFSAKGQMKIWSDSSRVIRIINNEGQTVASVNRQGNTTLSLPKGIYHLCCDGCSIKAIVK